MTNWYSRTELILGREKNEKLRNSHVLVVGLGGVGAYAAENLCRAGIGTLTLVDSDNIDITNINRQLPAMNSTIGRAKTDILTERFMDINPAVKINPVKEFVKDEKTIKILKLHNYDYVVDAIDTLSPKVHLILNSVNLGLKIVSSMGAGNKLDPTQVKIADISKSYNCGLARALRKRLHRNRIYKGFKVVFSPEEAAGEIIQDETLENKNSVVGTISYMPAVFGCFCASAVINDLVVSC